MRHHLLTIAALLVAVTALGGCGYNTMQQQEE